MGLTVEKFTVGNDKEMDLLLAPFDVLGSIAHVKMLAAVGLLQPLEGEALVDSLRRIYPLVSSEGFRIGEGMEDIHSQVEWLLTTELGDIGKKIHAARSRNDQVLLDIKLYLRHAVQELAEQTLAVFDRLQSLSEKHRQDLLPGYTHLQLAMPSSFGLFFGAYAEALADDMAVLLSAYQVIDKNPLGSAAGYGSSFPIDRKLTTELLGFADLNYNVVYAQMGRGKAERITAQAISGIAETIGKLAMDVCLYLNQGFGFVSFPAELTTGSSIMPHKKNPDVFEIIRGKCNLLRALPNSVMMLTANLPSGYHRDLQLLKECLFPAFSSLRSCLEMAELMLDHLSVSQNILSDPKYEYLFSVEEVNKLVVGGMPFRDAYKKVGQAIEAGDFEHSGMISHTHIGSMGNLCNPEIKEMMQKTFALFRFEKSRDAFRALLEG